MIDYGFCQSELPWGLLSETDIRRILAGIRDAGASRVRMGTGAGTWDNLDLAVRLSVESGLKPLVCIQINPTLGFDSSPGGYGNLCKAVATRYGPLGGDLRNTVAEVEILNEPNWFLNPPGNASPALFVQYLAAGHTAVKSVHTSCKVIAGGTTGGSEFFGMVTPVHWYEAIYAAGGGQYFDSAGFHWYVNQFPTPAEPVWKYLTGVRDVMIANGDAGKTISVTEVGVGFPAPNVPDLVTARDWLKAMVEGIESYSWTGPFYVYNWHCYSGGDGIGGNYGMVSIDFAPREPVYSYVKSIAGTPSDPLDIVPPTPPTAFTVTTTGPRTAQASWSPATDDVGVTVYRIKNAADDTVLATTTQIGQTSAPISNLTPGTPFVAYATALDAAGNESDPSNTDDFTTDAPSGALAYFQYNFTGTGSTVPNVFVQLGLGFTVTSGVALPNPPTTDGVYLTVAPYTLDMQSPDHSSQIGVAAASTNPYLAALSLCRMSPDGTQFAGSLIAGGGVADACQIFTYSGGVLTVRDARNTTPLLPGEFLDTTTEGNVYTAVRVRADGTRTEVLSWTDLNGDYPGTANVRPGFGWWHLRVDGVNYTPPGITGLWKASDLNAVSAPDVGRDLWKLAITNEDDLGLVVSTGLWQAAL